MLLRRALCCVAILGMLVFATAVSADTPAPTGTIVSGTVLPPPPYPYAYGYPYGYGGYRYAPGYVVPNVLPPGVTDGIACGGVYSCPLNLPVFGYGTYVRGNLYCGLSTCGVAMPIQR